MSDLEKGVIPADPIDESQSPQTDSGDAGPKPTRQRRTRKKNESGENSTKSSAPLEEAAPPKAIRPKARARERIVTIDAERSVETEADKAKSDLIDLLASMKNGKFLTDTIHGVERPAPNAMPRAVLNHGIYRIVIPANELTELPEDTGKDNPNEVYNNALIRRLGSEIDYIVKGIDPEEEVAVASRLDAMAIKRKQFFFGTDKDGNNLLYEGINAEARVCSVFGGGILVEVFGVETYIPVKELAWHRMQTAIDSFIPGQKILVRITKLDRTDRDNIQLEVSARLATTNPYEAAMKRYDVYNLYVGTVSVIDTSGVFVSLDGGIDCLCSLPRRDIPSKGSRATVRILGKDLEANQIWGHIVHISAPVQF